MTAYADRPEVQEVTEELAPLARRILAQMQKAPSSGALSDGALGELVAAATVGAAAYFGSLLPQQPAEPPQLVRPLQFCPGCGQPREVGPAGAFTLHKATCKGGKAS